MYSPIISYLLAQDPKLSVSSTLLSFTTELEPQKSFHHVPDQKVL